jgi:hypothetical protein
LLDVARQLTPEQRLRTHLEHNQLVHAFHRAGRRRRPSARGRAR